MTSDARDCGIQIFDKFLALIIHDKEEKNSSQTVRDPFNYSLGNFAALFLGNKKFRSSDVEEELDPNIVSYAAAVSIILGSKLNESKGELTLVRLHIISGILWSIIF